MFFGFGDPSDVVLMLRQGWQVPRLLSNLIWRNLVGSSSAESGDGLGDLNSIKQPSGTQTLVSLGIGWLGACVSWVSCPCNCHFFFILDLS